MNRNIIPRQIAGCLIATILVTLVFVSTVSAQPSKKKTVPASAPAKSASSTQTRDRAIIDSLGTELLMQLNRNRNLDSMFKSEQAVSADLREQIIRLDDYRKKLEGTIASFKGENLHLNQSNRILIIFNAMVAILLLVTLVFFLRRIGRKGTPPAAAGKTATVAASPQLEDKLAVLERLGKLREKGLLSEEEFNTEKQRIFGRS